MLTGNVKLMPLDVLADLNVVVDGENVRVTAEGALIVVEVPSLRAARQLLRTRPFMDQRSVQLQRIDRALRRADLTAEVRVQGEVVARLGTKAQPGSIARLLRLSSVEVRPGAALASAVRRKAPLALAAAAGLGGMLLAAFWWMRRD